MYRHFELASLALIYIQVHIIRIYIYVHLRWGADVGESISFLKLVDACSAASCTSYLRLVCFVCSNEDTTGEVK